MKNTEENYKTILKIQKGKMNSDKLGKIWKNPQVE